MSEQKLASREIPALLDEELRTEYATLAQEADDRLVTLSFAFYRFEPFKRVAALGAVILPLLIEDLRSEPSWWRSEMIPGLAANALGQCIYYPKEIVSPIDGTSMVAVNYYDHVSHTLRWWDQYGSNDYLRVFQDDLHWSC